MTNMNTFTSVQLKRIFNTTYVVIIADILKSKKEQLEAIKRSIENIYGHIECADTQLVDQKICDLFQVCLNRAF